MLTRTCMTLLASLLPLAAAALPTSFVPYVAERLQYDSNVFELNSPLDAQARHGSSAMGDAYRRDMVGFKLRHDDERPYLQLRAEGSRFSYNRFTDLNREEYGGDAQLNVRAGDWVHLRGHMEYHRRLAPFADRSDTELLLERERIHSARVVLLPEAMWRTTVGVRQRELATPPSGESDFRLSEDTVFVELREGGDYGLRLGMAGELARGRYHGQTDPPGFDLVTIVATGDYDAGSRTILRFRLGRSMRQSLDDDVDDEDLSENTGFISVNHRLSGLSSVELQAARRFVQDRTGPGAVIEDELLLSLGWWPLVSLRFELELQAQTTDYDKGSRTVNGRTERYRSAALRAHYRFLQRLFLRPLIAWREQDSSLARESFTGTLIGVELGMAFAERSWQLSNPFY